MVHTTADRAGEDALSRGPQATGHAHDSIAVRASADGVEALSLLMRGLLTALAATLVVVLHAAPQILSHFPEILIRQGPLPSSHPH